MPTLESNYRDITRQFRDTVQQPSPLVVCELVRVLDGRFCFDWGQATHCFATTIEVKRGDTIKGSASFTAGGGTFGVEVQQTLETAVTYKTSACDVCNPVICFDGQLQLFECERFLGRWSWTTRDPIWRPRSRGRLSPNCTKNHPACNCQPPQQAARLHGTGGYVALREPPTGAHLLTTVGLRPVGDGDEVPIADRSKMARLAGRHVEQVLGISSLASGDVPALGGVTRPDGGVTWLTGPGVDDHEPPVLVSVDLHRPLRGHSLVTGPRLPVLAVGPCRQEGTARARVTITPPGDSPTEAYDDEMEVSTETLSTYWTEVDLAEFPSGSTGTLSVTLTDKAAPCDRTVITEPFVIKRPPRPSDW